MTWNATPAAGEERQLVILFVDIVGSTSLYEQIGDASALHLISTELSRLETIITINGGTIIKRLGDGLMATFPNPRTAFHATSTMIDESEQPPHVAGQSVQFRAGLHVGPVVERDGDVYGDAVNVAARLQSLARPGEPLTSAETVGLLGSEQTAQVRFLNMLQVKGRSEPVRAYAIMPPAPEEDGTVLKTQTGPDFTIPNDEPTLKATFGGAEHVMTTGAPPLLLGRDKSCTLVVPAPLASRRHATITAQRGRFQITDSSTNGTYITLEDGSTFHLFRDSFDLQGHGRITLGEPPGSSTLTVEFTVSDRA